MIRIIFLLLLPFFSVMVYASDITFTTADNAQIEATYIKRGPQAIIMAHGVNSDKDNWGKIATRLEDKNFSLLILNLRGFGNSTQGDQPKNLYEDILGAIRYLQLNHPKLEKIFLLGSGIGGAAVADASVYADEGSINRMILISPTKISQPELIKGYVLFITNEKEERFDAIRADYENAANNPKSIEVLLGSVEEGERIFDTKQYQLISHIILKFFRQDEFTKKKIPAENLPAPAPAVMPEQEMIPEAASSVDNI